MPRAINFAWRKTSKLGGIVNPMAETPLSPGRSTFRGLGLQRQEKMIWECSRDGLVIATDLLDEKQLQLNL